MHQQKMSQLESETLRVTEKTEVGSELEHTSAQVVISFSAHY